MSKQTKFVQFRNVILNLAQISNIWSGKVQYDKYRIIVSMIDNKTIWSWDFDTEQAMKDSLETIIDILDAKRE